MRLWYCLIFLSRFSDTDQLAIHDQAEKMVLWDICCDLEKILPKPFSGCYVELLEAARSKVRDIEE